MDKVYRPIEQGPQALLNNERVDILDQKAEASNEIFLENLSRVYPRFEKLQWYLNKLDYWNIVAKHNIRFILDDRSKEALSTRSGQTTLGYKGKLDSENTIIGMTRLLFLTDDIELILHAFIHEVIHAGLGRYLRRNKNSSVIEVDDESATDLMTKQILEEEFDITNTKTGYDVLRNELENFFFYAPGEKKEILGVYENQDHQTVQNILEIGIIDNLLAKAQKEHVFCLSAEYVLEFLEQKYGQIAKLFPRILNKIFDKGADVHDECQVSFEEFNARFMSDLLSRLSFKLLVKKPNVLIKMLNKKAKAMPVLSKEGLRMAIINEGLMYLFDNNASLMDKYLEEYMAEWLMPASKQFGDVYLELKFEKIAYSNRARLPRGVVLFEP